MLEFEGKSGVLQPADTSYTSDIRIFEGVSAHPLNPTAVYI